MTAAQIFLTNRTGASEAFNISNDDVEVYGSSSAYDNIAILEEENEAFSATNVTVASTLEKVFFTNALSSYKFKQGFGSNLEVYNSSDVLIASIADVNGKHISFASGAEMALVYSSGTNVVSIGGVNITTTAAALTIDTTAPTAPTIALASDTGSSASDFITSNGAINVTGIEMDATWAYTLDSTAGTPIWVLGTGASATLTGAGATSFAVHQTDVAGNTSLASTAHAVTLDTTAPTLNITSSVATLTTGETATLSFTFSEAPIGFAEGDITATHGALSGFAVNGINPNIYTATFTPSIDVNATASITVASSSYTDVAGNNGTAGTTPALEVDTILLDTTQSLDISAGSSSSAASFDSTYNFTAGTYTYTIVSFNDGDVLNFPDGNAPTMINTNLTDTNLTAQWANGGNVITVNLTGIPLVDDGNIYGVTSFNTAFGTGSIA